MDDRNWVELLEHYLEALEGVIRGDLAALAKHRGTLWRGDRKQLRLLDLTDALEALTPAREALARCPAGAELAMRVVAVELNRLRPAAELADLHTRGARKGAATTRAKRRKKVERVHEQIRARAADMNPDLTPASKAAILAGAVPRSARTIRRIITK